MSRRLQQGAGIHASLPEPPLPDLNQRDSSASAASPQMSKCHSRSSLAQCPALAKNSMPRPNSAGTIARQPSKSALAGANALCGSSSTTEVLWIPRASRSSPKHQRATSVGYTVQPARLFSATLPTQDELRVEQPLLAYLQRLQRGLDAKGLSVSKAFVLYDEDVEQALTLERLLAACEDHCVPCSRFEIEALFMRIARVSDDGLKRKRIFLYDLEANLRALPVLLNDEQWGRDLIFAIDKRAREQGRTLESMLSVHGWSDRDALAPEEMRAALSRHAKINSVMWKRLMPVLDKRPDGSIAWREVLAVAGLPCAAAHVKEEELNGHKDIVTSVAISGNGRLAMTGGGGDDKKARVWDTTSGRLLKELSGFETDITCVALNGDGRFALTGTSYDATVRLWNVEDNLKLLKELQGHEGEVNGVALSDDGRIALTGSDDMVARVWDLTQTGKKARMLQELKGHEGEVNGVALSGDGRVALTGSSDETARVWNTNNGNRLQELRRHESIVTSVALNEDGRIALTGGADNKACLWCTNSGQLLKELKELGGYVNGVALSGDGRIALTGSDDMVARVWDLAQTGSDDEEALMLQELNGHEGEINGVALSGNGRFALTGSDDKTARVWSKSIEQRKLAQGPLLRKIKTTFDTLVRIPDVQAQASG